MTKSCAKCGKTEGSLRGCSACKEVFYCSKECQRVDWKDHKKTCKGAKKKPAAKPTEKKGLEKHLRDDDAPDVEVTWADQQNINAFGRLNTRLSDVKEALEKKRTARENLKSCSEEIEMLLDDDSCIMRVGEVFISVTNEEAEEHAEKRTKELEQEEAELATEKEQIETEMEKLKAVLYAKFGKSINLETADDDE